MNNSNIGHSFTVKCSDPKGLPICDVYVSKLMKRGDTIESFIKNISSGKKYRCLIDTGSTTTGINRKIIEELDLEYSETVLQATPNATTRVNCYKASFLLPNNTPIHSEGCIEINNEIDVILGMDVMRYGNLSIKNRNGITTIFFQFLIPVT